MRCRIAIGLAGCLAFLAISAGAARADDSRVNDLVLGLKVRAALWQDPELGSLSLEVTVKQGMATIYGAVPSEHFRQQAADVVGRVPGIKSVSNLARVRSLPPKPQRRQERLAPLDRPKRPPSQTSIPIAKPPANNLAPEPQVRNPTPGQLLQRQRDLPRQMGEIKPQPSSRPPTVRLLPPEPIK
jgi:hypothetical protein